MSIDIIIDKADKQLDYGSYKKAEKLYREALTAMSEPRSKHERFFEVQVAIGDTLIWQNKIAAAAKLFEKIKLIEGAESNAYLHLRLGQLAFESDNLDVAQVELKKALKLGGEELFEDESEDYYQLALK